MSRQMIEDDIGARFGPNPISSHQAHILLESVLGLYYQAQDAHDRNEKFTLHESAVEADKARGRFLIAICEWARKRGAKIDSSNDGGTQP